MITATGLGSGLDIDALVAGLVAAESQPPTQRLLSQEAATTSEIAGYSRLSAALSALESSVSTLNASSAFTSQTVLSDNIDQDIWEKWIFIATIAGATTLFQTSIDKISKKPNGKIFIQNLWNECVNISKENGYELRAESKNLHEELLFKSNVPFKASMLVDMEKKLMTEHEHIFFEFIKLGKKKKLNTSLLETCHLNMSIYEDNLNKIG